MLKSTHQCIDLEVNRVKLWFNIYLFKKMLPQVLPTLINCKPMLQETKVLFCLALVDAIK